MSSISSTAGLAITRFALLETKMALTMILQRFKFELATSYSDAPHIVITLLPMHGAQIRLEAI